MWEGAAFLLVLSSDQPCGISSVAAASRSAGRRGTGRLAASGLAAAAAALQLGTQAGEQARTAARIASGLTGGLASRSAGRGGAGRSAGRRGTGRSTSRLAAACAAALQLGVQAGQQTRTAAGIANGAAGGLTRRGTRRLARWGTARPQQASFSTRAHCGQYGQRCQRREKDTTVHGHTPYAVARENQPGIWAEPGVTRYFAADLTRAIDERCTVFLTRYPNSATGPTFFRCGCIEKVDCDD